MIPEDVIDVWRDDPLRFVLDVFFDGGRLGRPDRWQEEGLIAIGKNQRVCFKACKGPGKTCWLAWIIWWWMVTRPHCNIAAISITAENLKGGLWKELAKWQLRSKMLKDNFDFTAKRISAKGFLNTWWTDARAFSKQADPTQQADALAGLHADYMLFVIDEAGGIPDSIMATAEAGLSTGIECKIVLCGNPTHLSGPLYRACTTQRHLYYVGEITGDPDDPNRSPRISIQWAKEQIEQYGRDNPWVQVNVFGHFPPTSLNSLLGPDEVRLAMGRKIDPSEVATVQKRLGVDVARFGDDKTVIFPRQGLISHPPKVLRNMRSNEIADEVARMYHEFGAEAIYVDDTGGYGAGVTDSLLQIGLAPIPVNFSSKPNDSRFYNRRAEMWWNMAEWIKRGGVLPPDLYEIVSELSSITYSFKNDKIILEDKKQIKAHLGYSPDMADALALTFAHTDIRSSTTLSIKRANKMEWDYDPYSGERY